jgi:hypothetical protein
MDQLRATQAIFKRWIQQWPGLTTSSDFPSGVPYTFDNVAAPEGETLARVGIISQDTEQWTLGRENRKWLNPAFIDVRLSGPLNTGRKPSDKLVKAVRAIYQGKRFGEHPGEEGIICHACSVNELKRDRDAAQLWIVSIVCPYEWIEKL